MCIVSNNIEFFVWIVFLLLIIVVPLIPLKRKNSTRDDVQSTVPQPSTPRNSSYVSVDKDEDCQKIYFDSSTICESIRYEIGMDSITLCSTDNLPNESYVKKGDVITFLHFKWEKTASKPTINNDLEQSRDIRVLATTDGYILYHSIPLFCSGSNFLVATIYKDYNTLIRLNHPFEYSVNETGKLFWVKVNGEEHTQYLWLTKPRIRVSFNLRRNKPIMLVWFPNTVDKGEQIRLSFENNASLCFSLNGKTIDDGIIIPLSSKDFDCFLTKRIISVQVTKEETIAEYLCEVEEQESIIRFASALKNAIRSIEEEKEWEERIEKRNKEQATKEAILNIKTVDDSCWVYLMHDLANDAYKIGISSIPEYRERTLQEILRVRLSHRCIKCMRDVG